MARNSEEIRFFDFTGGLNTKSPVTHLRVNESLDLSNINILPTGGFEKRNGNTVFNGTAMASGAAVHGIGYFKTSAAAENLMAIAGTKIFKSDSLDGTMDDITGAVSITTGADKIWTYFTMNDLAIFVGGAPDAPIKWSGTGNAAALGGTPPSGNFGFHANRRAFIGNTAANPSRIAWSILGNPEDWSGAGSGTQDVQTNDGDTLVGCELIGTDHLILFKQNSIHELIIKTAPFPLFPLFRNVGAISKNGIVAVDGEIYFITPEPRMKSTNGEEIKSYPDTIDNYWDSLSKTRLQYIHGLYYPRLRQIWWFCSTGSSSTHDIALIWDLNRKCWLRHLTGYKMNVSCLAQSRVAYCGAYDGKIYKQDVASTYTDASETSPGAINAYWRTGWMDFGKTIHGKSLTYADLNFVTQSTGSFQFAYGFDFNQDRKSETVLMTSGGAAYGTATYGTSTFGGKQDKSKMIFTKGNGKFVQFLLKNNNASEGLGFNGFEALVNVNGPQALR